MDDSTIIHRYNTVKKALAEPLILIMEQDGKHHICGEDASTVATKLTHSPAQLRGRGEYSILEFDPQQLDTMIYRIGMILNKRIGTFKA
jgi:hypothetical protein